MYTHVDLWFLWFGVGVVVVGSASLPLMLYRYDRETKKRLEFEKKARQES